MVNIVLGPLLAITASFFWSLSTLFVKKGLSDSTSFNSVLVSALVNVIVFWPLTFVLSDFSSINSQGLIYFVLGGLAGPSMGRLLRFVAVERIGLATSSPVMGSTPLFSAILAVLILREEFTFTLALGTLSIVSGIMLLSGRVASRSTQAGIMLGLISSFFFALGDFFGKTGLQEVNDPLIGSAIGTTTTATLFASYAGIKRKDVPWKNRGIFYFILTGFGTTIAILASYAALSVEKMVVVSPLFSVTPLFSLMLSYFFLKVVEKVTFVMVLSSLLIIAGSVLIVVYG